MSSSNSAVSPDPSAKPLNIAIVGGGKDVADFLRLAETLVFGGYRFKVVGIANLNPDAEGVQLAREQGVEIITTDYREFFSLPDLHMIVELTGDEKVRADIERSKPPHIRLVDPLGASLFWELYRAQQAIIGQRTELREQVEAERARLSRIFNSLPDEILVLDTDLVVQDANTALLTTNNLRMEDISGKQCYEIEQRSRGECRIDYEGCPALEALRKGCVASRVVKFMDDSGGLRFAAVLAAPIVDADGKVTGIVESTRDITKRIELEEDLAFAESQLRQITALAPVAISVKNVQGQYLDLNQAAADRYRLTKESMLGKTDLELLEREEADALRKTDREVLRSCKEIRLEEQYVVDGHTRYLSTVKFPILDLQGVAQAVCSISMDVSEQKEIELDLKQTSEYLWNVMNNSPVIIMTTDLEGRVVSFNPGAEESLGYQKEEVMGTLASRFYRDPEEREMLLRRVINEGSVRDYQTSLVRKNGDLLPISLTLSQLKDSQGRMIGTVGMSKDISRRSLLMEQVLQSERLAAVGRLAAGVAHEINNPLAVIGEIAGFLSELLEDDEEVREKETVQELRTGLSKIVRQIKRGRAITHRLLIFSRKSAAETETADVNESLDELLTFVEKEALLASVSIHREYAEGLSRVRIEEIQMQEIFINLVKNAIQAIEGRGSGGDIWIKTEQREDHRVVVTVRDNGPGIPEEIRDRLFDPFVTTKQPGKGTGLGLSICYGIIKRYDGEITVESEVGKGSTFRVILPAVV